MHLFHLLKTHYLYHMAQLSQHSTLIKQKALELGFSACGIAAARKLDEEENFLRNYLNHNYHGKMDYMANHFNKRLDPTLLVPDAKSVIVVLLNYFPSQMQTGKNAPIISKYAYGTDYHKVIKKRLKHLLAYINAEIAPCEGRFFTDSAPVLERAWAVQAGLGWIGKNGLLLNKKLGSFFFIGELIVDLKLESDQPFTKEYCGSCNQCISACPTKALVKPYTLDARRCISYLTIELKESIPTEFHPFLMRRAYGCDICQDVCPWNQQIKAHQLEELLPREGLLEMNGNDWNQLDEGKFDTLFAGSAIKRAGLSKLKENITIINNTNIRF
jgi:epoxyqueuosine reductase